MAQATLWRKEHLVALRPIGNGLVLTILFYENEVKGPPDIPMTRPVVIADEELDLATKLITLMPGKHTLQLVLGDVAPPLAFAPCSWGQQVPSRVETWRRDE